MSRITTEVSAAADDNDVGCFELTDAMVLAAVRERAPRLFANGLVPLPRDGSNTRKTMAEEEALARRMLAAAFGASTQVGADVEASSWIGKTPAATNGERRESTFQLGVHSWLQKCFGVGEPADRREQNHRFLEEALELVQACGCTSSEARQLVDYVFQRPVGDQNQEAGGVMITLAALCLANRIDMYSAGEMELLRVNQSTVMQAICAKWVGKPMHLPLVE